jgi:hypothetical protein
VLSLWIYAPAIGCIRQIKTQKILRGEEMNIKRAISEWKDDELSSLESRYRERGLTEGGVYTLAEIRLEQRRRSPNPFGVRETAVKILELAAASGDGLTTYGELWSAFRPNEAWKGNASVSVMSKALDRVIAYCVDNRLPIISTLVVRTGSRSLSDQAVQNIYEEVKALGVDVGLDAAAFVLGQTDQSRKLLPDTLPAAE